MTDYCYKDLKTIKVEEVVELVKDLTPIPEMATLLCVSETDLRLAIDDMNNDLHYAYYATLAKVKRTIRHNTIELAEANSPTAMDMVHNYIKDMENSL